MSGHLPTRRLRARRLTVGLALCMALGGSIGCRDGVERSTGAARRPDGPAPSARPPIILVSIDTLRSDHLPVYGYDGVETPNIDALRDDAILFEHAYSPVPLTTPAHASLFTGLLPPDHGVRDNAGYRWEPENGPTLATLLSEDGYATGGAVSAFTVREETGLGTGFDVYDDELEALQRATPAEIQRPGDQTVAVAVDWLRGVADRPFFLFLHLYEPHAPFAPPEPFASRFGHTYAGEIAFADHLVGELLDELRRLGLYDEATIVLLSDHGEGLNDHGEREHGILLYRESLQVPLLLKLPGGRHAGETAPAPAQLTDVPVTLLELAGIDVPTTMDGVSLLELLDDTHAGRPIYSETFHPRLRYGWSSLTSLIRGRFHYIHGPAPELYDLEEDFHERFDVLRGHRGEYLELRGLLADIDSRLAPPFEADAETRKALTSLGYLASTSIADDGPRPDPKSQLDTLEPLRAGIEALSAGDTASAIVDLRAAVETNAELVDGWQFLGLGYDQAGRSQEAYDAYSRAFTLSNGSPALLEPLARVCLELGKTDEAIAFLAMAIEQTPEKTSLRFLRTRLLIVSNRLPEALEAAEATIRIAAGNPDAHYQRGAVLMGLRRPDGARRDFERTLEIEPNHPAALNDLAVLLTINGETARARELLERLLALQPDNEAARQHLQRLDEVEPSGA